MRRALDPSYDAGNGIITVCYEAIADIQALAKGAGSDPDKVAAFVTGGVVEEVLHRMALRHPADLLTSRCGAGERTRPTGSARS